MIKTKQARIDTTDTLRLCERIISQVEARRAAQERVRALRIELMIAEALLEGDV